MKTIKIPRIGEKELLKLYINRTEIIEFPSGTAYEVTLKAGQIVHGMTIPQGIRMKVDHIEAQFSSQPFIQLFPEQANGFLRMMYLNIIRNAPQILNKHTKYPLTYSQSYKK